jgi:ABC-type Na+ efflux pump permease subunit
MPIWTLAKKEFRILLRDRLAAVILLGMPLLFVLVLGMLLGDTFGKKERLRISVVSLDAGRQDGKEPIPGKKNWAEVVQQDLRETGNVIVEPLDSVAEAEQLKREHKRAAILVFGPDFSERVEQCSFLRDGLNPFWRDGVYLDRIDVDLLKDKQQVANSAVIEQVAQVSLLRVLLPLMIGRAFGKLSDEKFIRLLGEEVNIPGPEVKVGFTTIKPLGDKKKLGELLEMAAGNDPLRAAEYRRKVGEGVQAALTKQFENFDLTGLTWMQLTRSKEGPREDRPQDQGEGLGFLPRGAARYQILVPSYTVMFAFFLVLNVGWVLVAERQQGTLKRLRTTPITRTDILLGKLIPYFLLSLGQGFVLLIAGKLIFGMKWGPDSWPWWQQVLWLIPVVFSTSLAAMGLAMLVAALARTEAQVALYGAVPVLIMALIGGCVLPRDLMPEQTQSMTLYTPHGWALAAYRELLTSDATYLPNTDIVTRACLVLSGFGLAFLAAAWASLRLD